MKLINFQARFAEAVESGEKHQTICRVRKVPIKPGDTLRLYTGLRTKAVKHLKDVVCKEVHSVILDRYFLAVDGQVSCERVALAHADGFGCFNEMLDWFEQQYGLPFSGVLLRW
jgi:hypothetical protein